MDNWASDRKERGYFGIGLKKKILVFLFFQISCLVCLAEEVDLKKILVYSSRYNLSLEDISDAVEVYRKTDWDFVTGQDLSDFCYYLPDLSISGGGELGRTESLSFQGSSPRQVKVMIEGIPLNSAASGHVNLNRFPLIGLKQVEIISTGPSVLWGSGLGGVVNFVYQIPKDQKAKLHLWAAKGSSRGMALQVAYNQKKRSFLSWIDFGESLSHRLRAKNNWYKFLTKIFIENDREIFFGYSQGESRSGILPDQSWYYQPYRTSYGKLKVPLQVRKWSCEMQLAFLYQDLISEFFSSPSDFQFFSRTDTEEMQLFFSFLGNRFFDGNWQWMIGLDSWLVQLDSSYLSKVKYGKSAAVFSNFQKYWNDITISTGLRLDLSSDFSDALAVSFGIKAPLRLLKRDWLINLNLSRAYSFPTLLWRYYDKDLSGIRPNPDLKPESAYIASFGIKYFLLHSDLDLTAYISDILDAIGLDRDENGDYFMRNYKRFLRSGITGLWSYNYNKDFSFKLGFQMNREKNCKTDLEHFGTLKLKIFWGIRYRLKKWQIDVFSYYQDWYQWPSAQARDHKWITDVELKYKLKKSLFYIKVKNITNTKFWDDYFYPVERRLWECGVEFSW